MKKLVTFRFDPELLARARRSARSENRTLTNYVETVLKKAVEPGAEREIDARFGRLTGPNQNQPSEGSED